VSVQLLSICESLNRTEWSVALRESIWTYPVVESMHVLTLGVFFGLTLVMDLRLLGRMLASVPADLMMTRLLPWVRGSFGVLVATGALLFYASPAAFYGNVFFRAKLLLLALAGLNIMLFHVGVGRTIAAWRTRTPPPVRARLAGAVSIAVWVSVIAAGRLIAYNWFR
jgi:hypothetical protein